MEELINVGLLDSMIESPGWRFFVGESEERLETLRNELEVGVTKTENGEVALLTHEEMVFKQGECKSLRWILNSPVVLRTILEEDKKRKEKENEDVK